jgi:ATP-dependent DNA helicase PIF1
LNRIRFGDVTEEIKSVLLSRQKPFDITDTNGIEPTRLYPYRKDVQVINETNLTKLVANKKERVMTYHVRSTNMKRDQLKKLQLEVSTTLCTNAQVILTVNLDMDSGLVNGSRGVIKGFAGALPIVQFMNGLTRVIDYYTYSTEEDDNTVSYSQIPLMLGWAITIHKSQGMTLDFVVTDLSNIFDYGQAYVTLSRVRSLDSLWIEDIDMSKIQCHPEVYEYYEKLRNDDNNL